jgi:LemA protein
VPAVVLGFLDELMNPGSLALLFLILVLLVVVLLYNRLVRSKMRVKEAWSGIDVQLKRRANLIPNLVETVKGYASHERTVFEEVTQARTALNQASGPAESTQANSILTSALGRLFAVAEDYPELQASENFLSLQQELSHIEEKIAYARQFYNRNVLAYNTLTLTFPNTLVARIFHFQPEGFFEAEDEARIPPVVAFGQGEDQ